MCHQTLRCERKKKRRTPPHVLFMNMRQSAYKRVHASYRPLNGEERAAILAGASDEWKSVKSCPDEMAAWCKLSESSMVRAPVADVEAPLEVSSSDLHRGIWGSSNDRRFVLGPAAMEAYRKQRRMDDVDKRAHTDALAVRPPVAERCAGALPQRRRVYGCFAEKRMCARGTSSAPTRGRPSKASLRCCRGT